LKESLAARVNDGRQTWEKISNVGDILSQLHRRVSTVVGDSSASTVLDSIKNPKVNENRICAFYFS